MTEPDRGGLRATSDIASANALAVLRSLSLRGPLARADLARELGAGRAATGAVVNRLLAEGLVVELQPDRPAGVGKPKVPIWFSRSGYVSGSAAIHADRVNLAVVNLRGEVLASDAVSIDDSIDGRRLGQLIASRMDGITAGFGDHLAGVGVTIPGLCDPMSGEIVASTHLPLIVGYGLSETLAASSPSPVVIEVDARALARSESWFGLGKERSSFVCLLTGDGLGAGIVVDRRVFSGDGRFDSEVGHMRVASSGLRCRCGLNGCWETIASSSWIRAEAAHRGVTLDRLADSATQLMARDSDQARDILDTYADNLAVGIANLVHALGMSTIVIEGPTVALADKWFSTLNTATRNLVLPALRGGVSVIPSRLGPQADVLGGAATAFDRALGVNP